MFFIIDVLDMAGWWTSAITLQIALGALMYVWSRSRSGKVISKKPKQSEEQRLLDWKPQPLVEEDVTPEEPPVMGKLSEGVLNLGATSFLSLHREEAITEAAVAAMHKYSVGSCGPRGFYGTIDVHLELEERLASWLGVEEVCVYSYGFSTIASAIPAYAKKSDLIFADECVNFAIQKGIDASRSRVQYYRHNDMAHLEQLLAASSEQILRRRAFIVAEAICYNTGALCPLPRLVHLRKTYKLRLILDESLSIGVLGERGMGLTEHFKVPMAEIDLVVGSLEHSMASVGGFCAGSHFVVEHQRLSGIGYCFSASAPPFLSQAAICALDYIQKDPSLLQRLRDNSATLQRSLTDLKDFRVGGDELSPVKHLYIAEELPVAEQQRRLKHVAKYCLERGIALSVAAYLRDVEVHCPQPSIRLAANNLLTQETICRLTSLLAEGYGSLGL